MAYAKGVLKFAGVQGRMGDTIEEIIIAAEKLGVRYIVHNRNVYYMAESNVWVYTGFRLEDFEV